MTAIHPCSMDSSVRGMRASHWRDTIITKTSVWWKRKSKVNVVASGWPPFHSTFHIYVDFLLFRGTLNPAMKAFRFREYATFISLIENFTHSFQSKDSHLNETARAVIHLLRFSRPIRMVHQSSGIRILPEVYLHCIIVKC